MEKVCKVCGIPKEFVPEGASYLLLDSQATTVMSNERRKESAVSKFTEEIRSQLESVAEIMGFPRSVHKLEMWKIDKQ